MYVDIEMADSSRHFHLKIELNKLFFFIDVGASRVPCSETYPGPHAFSEPETLALAQFIEKFNVKLYLAFHSFNQMLLFPFVSFTHI